jgi:hypothetical protein
MHIPAYKPLLNHEEWKTLSTLKVAVSTAAAAVYGQMVPAHSCARAGLHCAQRPVSIRFMPLDCFHIGLSL